MTAFTDIHALRPGLVIVTTAAGRFVLRKENYEVYADGSVWEYDNDEMPMPAWQILEGGKK